MEMACVLEPVKPVCLYVLVTSDLVYYCLLFLECSNVGSWSFRSSFVRIEILSCIVMFRFVGVLSTVLHLRALSGCSVPA